MQTATREETRFIQRIIIFVVFPLILCLFYSFWLSGRSERVQEDIADIDKSLSRAIEKYGTVPTLKGLQREKSVFEKMEQHFSTLETFATVKPIEPPEDVIEKGVYFKKQLYLAEKAIETQAANKEIPLPDTLGFSEALPSDREVSLLLRKLETVNAVVKTMLDKNVQAVTVIKLLDDAKHTDLEDTELPLTEIAIRIDVNCSHKSLIRILHAIGNKKPFIVVRDVGIKKFKKNILETSFVFSRFVTEE